MNKMKQLLSIIKAYYYIVTNLKAISNFDRKCLILEPIEQDYRDLAAGRWLAYKQYCVPEFTAQMTRDVECELYQYTFFHLSKDGRMLKNTDNLKQISLMIQIVETVKNERCTYSEAVGIVCQ